MARPQKKGLDYFPFDVGFFGVKSPEVRILKSRYHADGVVVYIYLLCTIYSNGYYFLVDNWEDFIFVISDEFKISCDKVEQIITFLCNRSMLLKLEVKGCVGDAVLTSHGIQMRYAQAMKRRKKRIAEFKGEYWLLTETEEAELDTFLQSDPFNDFSANNSDNEDSFSANNPVNSEINSTNKNKLNEIKLDKDLQVSKKVSNKKEKIESYDEIFENCNVSGRYKEVLIEFIRYLKASCGIVVLNDRLYAILVGLDKKYGTDELAKRKEIRRAIVNGYKRLECEEIM